MQASRLCELRDDFIRQWKRDFPLVPPPVLRGIDQVKITDVIDESQASGHIATLSDSLDAVNNKLDQLNEQIQRKQRVKNVLLRVLQTFDSNTTKFDAKARGSTNIETSEVVATSLNNKPTSSYSQGNNKNKTDNVTTVDWANGSVISQNEDRYRCNSSEASGVLCAVAPDQRCSPAAVCGGVVSSPLSGNKDTANFDSNRYCSTVKDTCDKSCGTNGWVKCVFIQDTTDVGIQCEFEDLNPGKKDKSNAHSTVIHHNVGVECEDDPNCTSCVADTVSNKNNSNHTRNTSRLVVHQVGQNTEVSNLKSSDSRYYNSYSGVDNDDDNYRGRVNGREHDEDDEEECCYYDNKGLKDYIDSIMFKRKKVSCLRPGGDEGGSIRGGKDNFLAVTSQRKLEREREADEEEEEDVLAGYVRHGGDRRRSSQASGRLDHSPVTGGNSSSTNSSVGNSPSLTRNFQMLKLTSGFDLVLDNSSDNDYSTDDRGVTVDDDDCDRNSLTCNKNKDNTVVDNNTKEKISSRHEKDNISFTSSNTADITPSSEIKYYSDSTDNDDVVVESDNNDDDKDDTTPTSTDSRALKFDYSDSDSSLNLLDSNHPDLISSAMLSSGRRFPAAGEQRRHPASSLRSDSPPPTPPHNAVDIPRKPTAIVEGRSIIRTNSDSTTTITISSSPTDSSVPIIRDSIRGGAPPPVARKPARPSTGKKLPSIPVGVEPVTRPLKSSKTNFAETQKQQQSSFSSSSNKTSIPSGNSGNAFQSVTHTDDPTRDLTVVTTPVNNSKLDRSNATKDPRRFSGAEELTETKPIKYRGGSTSEEGSSGTQSSPRSSPLSSILSSSPDFRASLVTGLIPAAPQAEIAVPDQSQYKSNLSHHVNKKLKTPPPETKRRSSVGELIESTTTTILPFITDTSNTSTCQSVGNSPIPQPRSASHNDGMKEERGADYDEPTAENTENERKLTKLSTSGNASDAAVTVTPSLAFTPASPPPPPLPKREGRRVSKQNENIRDRCSHVEENNKSIEVGMRIPQRPSQPPRPMSDIRGESTFTFIHAQTGPSDDPKTINDTYTTNTAPTSAPSNAAATTDQQGEYSRMSSSDTVFGDQSHHLSFRNRRSESFTSDVDVKDAIYEFDRMISDQFLDISEDMEEVDDSAPLEARPHRNSIKNKRRSSSVISYENWTINRALTASISSHHNRKSCGVYVNLEDFNFNDDNEDDNDTATTNDEDSNSNASMPSPDLTRQGFSISHGSKDSGLCDDMSVTESMHSELDLTGGRIHDLRQIQEMERWEEEEEEAAGRSDRKRSEDTLSKMSTTSVRDKDYYDSVSVTSDIVYLTGSLAKKAQKSGLQRGEEYDNNFDDDFDDDDTGAIVDDDDDDDDDDDHDKTDGGGSRLDTSSTASSIEEGDGLAMNSSYDETDSGHDGMLKMRQLLIKGVLDSEKTYLDILGLLIHIKRLMEASSQSSQPVIGELDIQTIFYNIQKLHDIHTDFVTSLEAKVKAWTHAECVGEIFKIFVLEFPEFCNYVNNYPNAVATIHRCGQESEQFRKITQSIAINSTIREDISLEDALFKPVQRVQRNGLVLHDLIKYTPEAHPDHPALQKALKLSQHNLEHFASVVAHTNTNPEKRRLVKSSFLVELVNGVRKLRYMFLFSDILICTKRETHRNNKVTFQIKWFAPLAGVSYDTKSTYKDDAKFSKKDDIRDLKAKIKGLKREMKLEMKKFDDKDKHRSLVNLGGAARTMDKLRKKILQYEGHLILASPKLPFKVSLEGGRIYTLLMTTDYEKEEWKEALNTLCKPNVTGDNQQNQYSSILVQDLINSVKEMPQVNKIGNVLLQKDEDIFTGILNVTIHKMNGLAKECDTYCCLEIDSFGHFFMMARTKLCEASRDPNWNEDFELELEGALTLRILCFKKGEGEQGDELLGRGALELDKQWLKGSFSEKTVTMNEISLVISVRHTPADKTMRRTPSRTRSAVFGVEISSCARREGKTVPTIITACIHEVEKRGMDEVGIYRVSGVTSDLQRMKKLFDRNISAGEASLEDADINAVTGVLKLYFRELPEPLFTEVSYQKFVGTLKLSDDEAKSQCILRLLHELPDTNYYTIVCLLEHLVKVARCVGDNRMSIHNLSTIFGPTLLAPAQKATENTDPLSLMFQGAEQVLQQSGVISYLLGLAISGHSLRRSS